MIIATIQDNEVTGIIRTLYTEKSITEDIRELIVQSASSMEIRKRALEEGYRPLAVDGIKKVLNGITTLEELNNKILMY